MRPGRSMLVFPLFAACCCATLAVAAEKAPRWQVTMVRAGDKAVSPQAAGSPILAGFDLVVDGKVIAPVRFSSNGLICGRERRRTGDGAGLTRVELQAKAAVGLSLSGSVTIERANMHSPGDDFPEISFSLRIDDFDPSQWEKAVGRVPFHFLTMSMPSAEVVHQRGWLNATPKADPFPLLGDIHAGTPEICSKWSRNWSYVVPIGAYPIPVAGLWAPAERLYVGYDFMGSRLGEQTERYLATAYCWQQGTDRQFIALVYPYAGRGFQTLAYPQKGTTLEGRFRVVYSVDLPATEDPNAMLQQNYFRRYGGQLPTVPAMNDLGWMPGATRLQHLPDTSQSGLIVRLPQGNPFEEPGTVEIDGWTAHRESAVNAAFRRGDRNFIDRLHREIVYLTTKAQRVTVAGDECLFWPKPLEGKWRDTFGGDAVKTLHNTNGWAAGIALVDLYRHEKAAEYLPLIDGIYNWTKHFVWTRNEFADVPSSPFAIGGTLSAAFLLDYSYAFCNDPQRADRAWQAVELARKITYRYMVAWACDNDHDDNLDSSFLWEPNSGRDWTGTACANEVHWNLDTLTQVYVNCGDPILNYYLRGALERWHLLYKDIPQDGLADYGREALSEWLGLFDGTMAGRGVRAGFGTADILPMNYPVGRSVLRVTCGQRAAFACCKGGLHWRIENYRYAPGVNFSFAVRSSRPEPFDVTLSFPFADLTDRPVSRAREGTTRTLAAGSDLVRSANAPSYVYLRGLRDGDTVTVGQVAADVPVLRLDNDWTTARADKPPVAPVAVAAFHEIALPLDESLPCDWDDVNSFAGLWPGRHWAWGVPFQLPAAPESTGPLGTRQECEVSLDGSAGSAYVLFAPKDSHGWVLIRGECSAPLPVVPGVDVPPRDRAIPARSVIVWQSWPPCFQRKLFAFQVPKAAMPAAGKIGTLRITPKDGASLLAVTQLVDKSREPHLAEVFAQGEAQCLAALAGEAKVTRFRMLVDGLPAGRIAILPDKELVGPVAKFLYATRLMKKCRRLTPEELLDAKLFNARNFPVLLNVGGENYAGSIHRDGDGVAAILNYLRSGGFLAMLTTQPLPFCYDGLDVSHKPRSLTPKMGFPIANQFETPPANAALRIGFLSDQDWLSGFPREIPFFNEGDLRLRSVEAGAVSRDAVYTPLVTVLGAGRSYGDIAAVAHFKSGPYRGAGLLFVWSRLLDDPQLGPPLIDAVMRKLLTLARGSGG